MKEKGISRRDFLKLTAMASAGVLLPREFKRGTPYSERLRRIFDLYTPMGFDRDGNLRLLPSFHEDIPQPIAQQPTRYSQETSVATNLVLGVKLLVVHFDGADKMNRGRARTAQSTVNGLNGNYASTHWCVDEYPVNPNGDEKKGFGVVQTQKASGVAQRPYQGAHVLIGINLKTKAPDVTRLKTMEMFEKLGIKSKLKELIEAGDNDYDKYSVGFEQVGARFSIGFPGNFPTELQIANVLSLTTAVMKEYGLSPWDVVGHKEIQEKDDPGAEFMATLRVLLGVAAIRKAVPGKLVFGEGETSKYFDTIKKYLIILRGEEAYDIWQSYMGFEDFVRTL